MSPSVGEEASLAVPEEDIDHVDRKRDRFHPPPQAVCRFVYEELASDSTELPTGRELQRAVQRLVYGLVYRQVHALARRNEKELDRLVQDAATRALWSLPSFDCESKVSTWTWTICWRTLHDDGRTLAAIARAFRRAFQVETRPAVVDPEQQFEQGDRRDRMERALEQLSLIQRTVVVLYYFEDKSIDEIARILSRGGRAVPAKTVQSRLSAGRERLRGLLAEDSYFGAPPKEHR